MNVVLYLPEQAHFLAERWLQTYANNNSISLLSLHSSLPLARELVSQYPAITEIFVLPENVFEKEESHISLRNKIQALNISKAVLPISMDMVSLRFLEATNIPEITRYYSLIRKLWHLGIREFEIFNLNGSRRYHIPFFLDEFVDLHKGKRCFVVGNGPSLNQIEMKRLKDEIALGSNRCYLGYESWGFAFTYWGIMDRLQIEEYYQEYEYNIPKETIKFFPFEYLPLLKFENCSPVNHIYDVYDFPRFSDSCEKIYLGYSVTYMLIQIAAIMGCNPIILVGVDHNYNQKPRKRDNLTISPSRFNTLALLRFLKSKFQDTLVYDVVECLQHTRSKSKHIKSTKAPKERELWSASDSNGQTHFDSRYTAGKKRFVPQRPELIERALECAAHWSNLHGVKILNATPGTALKVFPLVPFNDLF